MLARFAAMAAVVAATAGGCKKDAKNQGDPAKPVAGEGSGGSAACAGAARVHGAFTGYHDDYPAALACARSKNVPLVIDMWAPWCHTCLSMEAYVLPDPRLADRAPRFVYLALDTDRDVNAAPVAKFPPAAWPTYFVVSPADEAIQSRFVGSASAEQFGAFLDDGERGTLASAGKPLSAWEAAAREGDQAASRKQWKDAAAAYASALEAAPKDWVRAADVAVSLVGAFGRAKDWKGCVDAGTTHADRTGNAASGSDLAGHVLGCAKELEASPPDAAAARAARDQMVGKLAALTADTAAPLSVDDRSDALMYLREGLEAQGKQAEAKQAATTQRELLDGATAAAKTPWEASTYNWPRSEVYLYLGVPLELVPALEKSTADLPEEYDPPYRLAWIYWKAGKLDLAKESIALALTRVYGPRKTRALAMLADIEKARGDAAAEREAREEIVATWQALPPEAQNADAIAKAKAEVAAMDAAGGSGSAK